MATRYEFAKKRPSKSTSSSGRWKWVGVVTGLLVVGGSTVWGAKYLWAARQVAAVRQAREQLFSEEMRNLPEEERREKFNALREQYDALPEAARDQLREEGRQRFEQMMDNRLKDFFALPPEQRVAEIDKQIDREEQRAKEWEKRRAEREKERASRGQEGQSQNGNRGNGSRGDGERRGGGSGSAAPGGGGPGGGGGGDRGRGGEGGRSSYRDPQRRNEWRKKRLDSTTPQSRAMRAEYRRLADQRRQQRGLPPSRGWGRG
ncbi:MAG: hypothetical protein KF708_19620 [Pirellulales bacterium]|nr:hypothetical protein [Pirellulales bacterium]